jgi:hypothetical protein
MKHFALFPFLMCAAALSASGAEKMTAPQLISAAKGDSAGLLPAITTTFDPKDLKAGAAWAGRGSDFFFATEASANPALVIDDKPGPAMKQVPGSSLWYASATLDTGRLHAFHYLVNGSKFGGKPDVPAFTPFSYLPVGVPSGTLSEKLIHTSKMYEGMKSEYWI